MTSDKYKYDVFVSHAVEDKEAIANELAAMLKAKGLSVWYSGDQLGIGDRIEQVIQEGLKASRFGVVILSHSFLKKDWTKHEYYALLAKEEREGQKVILPVLHDITPDELKEYNITIADTYGISSSVGTAVVAEALAKEVRKLKKPAKPKQLINRNRIITLSKFISLPAILLLAFLGYSLFKDLPADRLIEASVEQRIEKYQKKIQREHLLEMSKTKGEAVPLEILMSLFEDYNMVDAHYRNNYEFDDGRNKINYKKNVQAALQKDAERLTPLNAYGFNTPEIYLYYERSADKMMQAKYALLNTQPLKWKIEDQKAIEDSKYVVRVSYANNLRYIAVALDFSKDSDWKKEKLMTIKGFLPEETYVFENDGGEWQFTGLE